MTNMQLVYNYDLVEITRLLLEMRDNCIRKNEGEAYDDPKRKEKYDALNAAIDLINNPSDLIGHAQWIDRDGKTWCSKCGASNKAYKPPFCPHCGAKMDGDS